MTPAERAEMRRFRNRTLVVAGVLLGVAAVLWLVWRLSNLIFMVFVALFVTIAFEPAVHWLEKKGWKRGLAAFAVLVGVVVLAVGFLAALAPLFIAQVQELIEKLPTMIESFATWLNEQFGLDISVDPEKLAEDLGGSLQQIGGGLAGGVVAFLGSGGNFFPSTTTTALFAFFMLAELPPVKRNVFSVDPEKLAEDLGGSLQQIGGGLAGGVFAFLGSVGNFFLFTTTTALFAFFMLAELPQMQRTVLSLMPQQRQLRALGIWDVAV